MRELRTLGGVANVALVSMLVSACSGGTENPPPAGDPDPGSGAIDPGPNGAAVGPIAIEPGVEKTVCVTVRMNNKGPMVATKLVAELAPGSHHLIVYRSKNEKEDPVPKECGPFGSVLSGDEVPIFLVEKAGTNDLVFPAGTGLALEAHQMLKLEAHYINTGTDAIEGSGIVRAEGKPGELGELQPVDLAFWGTAHIVIPGHSDFTTPENFQTAMAGTTGFALTTHQHRFGTRMQVWYSQADTQVQSLADNTDWHEPPLYPIEPPITFDGTDGLTYQCSWKNTDAKDVTFGESALQEMCFLWMYYYPSKGFDVCLDGLCVNRD